jgi:Sulfotransferase family
VDPTAPDGGPPVVVLGVSRSGTTLLKQMLDHHPELAIPTESYFIPLLWDRHGEQPRREAFVSDIARLARVREWGVDATEVGARLGERPSFAEAIQSIYRVYAESRGKSRFGDKTPAYMQRLQLLERAFPGAHYVHLIRDGRDAALSFVGLRRRPRFNWARPRTPTGFAAQWRWELRTARAFGSREAAGRYHELQYERLVAEPEPALREVCTFLGLEFHPGMLEYHRGVDPRLLADHPKLSGPPTAPEKGWRERMAPAEVERFEAIAGEQLAELGYPRAFPDPSPAARARGLAERVAVEARIATWHPALRLARRSPVWRLRQVYIRRTSPGTGV